jgi:hypothetical protein
MKIFISYSREQVRVAQSIHVRLLEEGHKTFFDLSNLPAGAAYDAEIRGDILAADLLIFLISPDSVRPSSYARSELKIAQDRWPNPSRRVLPVMVEDTPIQDVPAYLTAVTILRPQGNLEADVLTEVANVVRRRDSSRRWIAPVVAVIGIGIAIAMLPWVSKLSHRDTACYLDANIQADPGVALSPGMMVDVTYAQFTSTFLASPNGYAAIKVGPFKASDPEWTISLRAPDGNVIGTESFQGCAVTTQEHQFREAYNLRIAPHS